MSLARCSRILLLVAPLLVSTAVSAQVGTASAQATHPVRLIVDSDLFSSADDVGALATAFALQNQGEAKVLAIGINTRLDRPAVADASPRCAAAIAQFYGHPQTPIGSSRPLHGTETNTVDFITPCASFAAAGTRAPLPVVSMYRRVLARQPDHSVVVVSLGYLANLAALLASPADAVSPQTGAQLIAAKVREVVVMGGGYPSRNGENNFNGDPGAAAQVAAGWPGAVLWDGYEVGDAIHTGQTISGTHPAWSPVRAAYEAFVGPGNWIYSYDLTAVYRAVRPADPAMTVKGPGTNQVAADGANQFHSDHSADQHYVRLNDPAGLDGSIEALLDQVPPSSA
jgi:Inosine-uridine preferring nucleoside hydrolase